MRSSFATGLLLTALMVSLAQGTVAPTSASPGGTGSADTPAEAVAPTALLGPPPAITLPPVPGRALQTEWAKPKETPYAPGVLLVRFKPDAAGRMRQALKGQGWAESQLASLEAVNQRHGLKALKGLFPAAPRPSLKRAALSDIYHLRFPPDADIPALAAEYAARPEVEWAEPDYLAHPAATTPDDPLFPGQWALDKIQAPAAWDVITGTPGVVIAVLDTGVDVGHPDLASQLWTNPGEVPGNGIDDDDNGYVDDVHGWNFIAETNEVNDDDGHGTRVAGAAAAQTNNSAGIAGVCWNCRVMSVKVMQAGGVANYSDVARGVAYAAAKGASVINISLGGYANSFTLRDSIAAAADTAVIVAAAGDDNTSTPFYPAAYPDVLAVGGTTESDTRASFSNYGSWVDLAAPAETITTTLNGGSYGPASGTSLAAPLAAGLAGLVRSQHPDWSTALVRGQILHTADRITDTGLGAGRINAAEAVTQVPHPLLTIASSAVNGDPLGHATAGEGASLAVTLGNDWLDATGMTGLLTTADPYVTVVTGTATFGDIPAGGMAAGAPIYSFTVASAAGYNHPIPFTLHLAANGGTYTATLPLTVTTRSTDEPVAGTIVADTTWTSDKTYIVNNNVGVAPGVTLTIQPGTVVRFNGNYNLNVGGTLIADGTQAQPIRFMPHGTGTWGRIYFDNPSADAQTDGSGAYLGGNILRWVHIEGAAQGIASNSATPYFSHMTLTSGGVGCAPGGTTLWIQDCTLAGGLSVSGGGQVWRNTVTLGNVSLSGTATVRQNRVNGNLGTGSNSIIQDNTVDKQVSAGAGSIVRKNIITGGVSVGDISTLEENQIAGSVSAGTSATVTSNTVRWGGLTVGGGSLVQDNDVEGATGWGVSASGSITLSRNRVVGFANGVTVGGGLVQGNLIANMSGVGLQVGSASVLTNTITGNGGNTLVVASGAPTIQGNNLEGNHGTFDLVNNSTNAITASGNWWGATDGATIDARIYDFIEDYNLGRVTYTPVLTGPVQSAPAYVRAITVTPSSPTGLETATFETLFSRPMDASQAPSLSFHRDVWRTYNTANSGLGDDGVTAVAIDQAGNRWFAHWNPYPLVSVLLADGSWQVYTMDDMGLNQFYVQTIAIDNAGSRWFGSEMNQFAVQHADGTWSSGTVGDFGLGDGPIRAIAVDPAGNKWFGVGSSSPDRGANVLRTDGSWQTYSPSNSGLASHDVSAIKIDEENNKWFGLESGVSVLRADGTWQTYDASNSGLPAGRVNAIAIDETGNKWFAVYGEGVSVLRVDGSWQTYSASNSGLSSNPVSAIAVDAAGNKWFAGSGVSVLRADGSWQTYNVSNSGLVYDGVRAIALDSAGNKWFGTGGGVSMLHGGPDAERSVTANSRWLSSNRWRGTYDISSLVPSGTHSLKVQNVVGLDGLAIAPNSAYTFTVDYIGTPATGMPPAPVVRACASPLTSTVRAQWTVPTTQTIGLYRYAIGTAPGLSDVTNWVTTTLTSLTRDNLNLLPGETYYFSVRARNTGGVWSDAGSSNGVVAGAGYCPEVDFTAVPTDGMAPLPVAFTAQSTSTLTSYLWSFGSGITDTQTSPVYTYTAPGTYTVTLDAAGPGGVGTAVKGGYISVIPDTVPPSGTLTIAGNAAYVPTVTVTLTTIAEDPSGLGGIRFSHNGLNYSGWITYTLNTSWTLTSGDGDKAVYAQVRDVPGNVATFTDTVTLDTTPPTATVVALPPFVADAAFTVTWTGGDLGAGLESFDLQSREGGGGWTDWLTTTAETTAPLTGTYAQTYYFRARGRDAVGNVGPYAPGDGDTHTTVDLEPPAGSLVINGGAPYANALTVTLNLSATDLSGVEAFQASNDGVGYSAWVSYTTAVAWTLTSGDEEKTVYGRFWDAVGHESDPVTDTVILHTEPPTGTLVVVGGAWATASPDVTLDITATDNLGVVDMCLANDTNSCTQWEPFAMSRAWTLPSVSGVHVVTAYVRDLAGNVGALRDDIVLDVTPPTAAVNPLTPYQTELSFPVSWSGVEALTGVADFDVQARDGDGEWADWITSTTALSSTFTGLDGHIYSFRARARDGLGNLGSYAPGNGDAWTNVDTTSPAGDIAINGGAVDTTSRDVTFLLSANGATQTAFSDDDASFGSWEPFASTRAYQLPAGDGPKTVYVRYRDPASNTTEASDAIMLNTLIPGDEGLTINNDASVTEEVTVTLTLKAPAHTRQMMVSNSSRFVAAEWESYAASRSWILAYQPGATVYQVYGRFRGVDGTVSPRYDDLINLHLTEPPPPVDSTPPSGSLVINVGADSTSVQSVALDVLAADNPGGVGVRWMYFREWKYDPLVVQWVTVRSSGWLPYAEHSTWDLAAGTGVKYIGAWFADGANNVSDPVVLDNINLVQPGDSIGEAQVTQYRQTFGAGVLVTATLSVTSGDADLYVWRPSSAATPDYWSNLPGMATEQLVFTAVEGEYLIEVHGYASSVFTLDIATDENGRGTGGQMVRTMQAIEGVAALGSNKPLPPHPLVTTKPGEAQPPAEEPSKPIYLPLIRK